MLFSYSVEKNLKQKKSVPCSCDIYEKRNPFCFNRLCLTLPGHLGQGGDCLFCRVCEGMEGVGVVIKLFYFSTSTLGNQHISKSKS